MPKYKVSYSGFYYVEADSIEDAECMDFDDVDCLYEEHGIDDVEEVDTCEIDL